MGIEYHRATLELSRLYFQARVAPIGVKVLFNFSAAELLTFANVAELNASATHSPETNRPVFFIFYYTFDQRKDTSIVRTG